jgi:hypothetical protein
VTGAEVRDIPHLLHRNRDDCASRARHARCPRHRKCVLVTRQLAPRRSIAVSKAMRNRLLRKATQTRLGASPKPLNALYRSEMRHRPAWTLAHPEDGPTQTRHRNGGWTDEHRIFHRRAGRSVQPKSGDQAGRRRVASLFYRNRHGIFVDGKVATPELVAGKYAAC